MEKWIAQPACFQQRRAIKCPLFRGKEMVWFYTCHYSYSTFYVGCIGWTTEICHSLGRRENDIGNFLHHRCASCRAFSSRRNLYYCQTMPWYCTSTLLRGNWLFRVLRCVFCYNYQWYYPHTWLLSQPDSVADVLLNSFNIVWCIFWVFPMSADRSKSAVTLTYLFIH